MIYRNIGTSIRPRQLVWLTDNISTSWDPVCWIKQGLSGSDTSVFPNDPSTEVAYQNNACYYNGNKKWYILFMWCIVCVVNVWLLWHTKYILSSYYPKESEDDAIFFLIFRTTVYYLNLRSIMLCLRIVKELTIKE